MGIAKNKRLLLYFVAFITGLFVVNSLTGSYLDRTSPVSQHIRDSYYQSLESACSTETEQIRVVFVPLDMEYPVRITKSMVDLHGETAQQEWILNRKDAGFDKLCYSLKGRIVPKRINGKDRVDVRWKIGFYKKNNQANFLLYGDGAGLADFDGAMIYYPRSIDRLFLKHFGASQSDSLFFKFATRISFLMTFI